jgi:hypothetical protein
MRTCPSALSLSLMEQHHLFSANEVATALQFPHRPRRPLLLRPHSPTTAFHDEFDVRIHRRFHLPDHWQAPVTTPEAAAVPVLALVFLSLLTSLADVTRRTLSSYVPGSRPGIVSGTILVPISASRTQKLWLTRRRKAFTVRLRLQGESLARAFARFMVELFMRRHFCQPPEPGQRPGPACRQVRNSPRKPRLDEHSATHRSSNPLDGIC